MLMHNQVMFFINIIIHAFEKDFPDSAPIPFDWPQNKILGSGQLEGKNGRFAGDHHFFRDHHQGRQAPLSHFPPVEGD